MEVEADEGTVTAAVAGDAAALTQLLRQFSPGLLEHFSHRIRRRYRAFLTAEDVLQVTLMEAFLHVRNFVSEGKGSFASWLRRIGENNIRDAVRMLDADKRPSESRRLTLPQDGDTHETLLAFLAGSMTTPTEHLRRSDAKALLNSALVRLPPDYARVLKLYHLEERSIAEVAASFDPPRTHGAVHMLRLRACDCLRELLGQPERFLRSST